jgi:WD40 repeat protein
MIKRRKLLVCISLALTIVAIAISALAFRGRNQTQGQILCKEAIIFEFDSHNAINRLAVSRNGRYLAYSTKTGTVSLTDLANKNIMCVASDFQGPVLSVHPSRPIMVYQTGHNRVRMISAQAEEDEATDVSIPQGTIVSMAISPLGDRLAIASDGSKKTIVSFCGIDKSRLILDNTPIEFDESVVMMPGVTFSADGKELAIANLRGCAVISCGNKGLLNVPPTWPTGCKSVSYSADGEYCGLLPERSACQLFNLKNGQQESIHVPCTPPYRPECMFVCNAEAKNAIVVLICGPVRWPTKLAVFSTAGSQIIEDVICLPTSVQSVAFSPQSNLLVLVSEFGGILRVIDLNVVLKKGKEKT